MDLIGNSNPKVTTRKAIHLAAKKDLDKRNSAVASAKSVDLDEVGELGVPVDHERMHLDSHQPRTKKNPPRDQQRPIQSWTAGAQHQDQIFLSQQAHRSPHTRPCASPSPRAGRSTWPAASSPAGFAAKQDPDTTPQLQQNKRDTLVAHEPFGRSDGRRNPGSGEAAAPEAHEPPGHSPQRRKAQPRRRGSGGPGGARAPLPQPAATEGLGLRLKRTESNQ